MLQSPLSIELSEYISSILGTDSTEVLNFLTKNDQQFDERIVQQINQLSHLFDAKSLKIYREVNSYLKEFSECSLSRSFIPRLFTRKKMEIIQLLMSGCTILDES
eukprot:TRINITY_DN5165_c0_g1_i1.p1 TRINITY_DN5165_c0_g1~~TRINITY_DN5165_c0_g1_i1.p1  ORF type:complete len:105 (+),score=6.09 TRINITY_DN5165_c0_g1_i1:356-670(+)